MAEANGLTAAVANAPSMIAHSSGADRKCHADTPAARATISSLDRVSRQNARIPPSKTANGRICIATNGIRSAAICTTIANVASGLVADRRSSSMKSNSDTIPASAASIDNTAAMNCRATYSVRVTAIPASTPPAAPIHSPLSPSSPGSTQRQQVPMADIGFYHLTRTPVEAALPALLGRTLAAGERAVILCATADRADALSKTLWDCKDPDWLPNATARTPAGKLAPALQPIWLTDLEERPNAARYLFRLDSRGSELPDWTRIFDLFDGLDGACVTAARLRWSAATSAGHVLTYWKQTERGWSKT